MVTNGTTKQWELAKVVGGTTTVLQTGNYGWVVGNTYVLKMTFDGRAIVCAISSDGGATWTPAASAIADYTFLSGKVGVAGAAAKCSFDDIDVVYRPPATAPEIRVDGNATWIGDDDATPSTADHTDFGFCS